MKDNKICPIASTIKPEPIDYSDLNSGDIEKDLELEAQKILKRKQQDNLGVILDSNYYFNVYFICEQDKNEFFEKLGISDLNDMFINGYELAKRLGIDISKKEIHLPKPKYVKSLKISQNGNKKTSKETRHSK